MSKKISYDEIKQIYEANGLTLLETETKGITYRYKGQDADGYLYYYGAKHLKEHKLRDCFVHRYTKENPFYWENIQHYMEKNVYNGTKILSRKDEYKNRDSVMTFQCGVCGGSFQKRWSAFMAVDFKMCNRCYNYSKQNKMIPSKRIDPFLFHKKIKGLGLIPMCGDNLCYHSKILVQDRQGYRGYVTVSSLYSREAGFDKFNTKNPFTLDNLRLYAFLNGWDCIIPDQKYNGNKNMLDVICSCGRTFSVSGGHFLGGKYKCNQCRGVQSELSGKVEQWLIEHNIPFIREKKYPDCKNIKQLPFDFYIENCGCIEVDGQQHYTDRIHGKENMIKTQINDGVKSRYCKEHGIPLLRLPYWEIEDNKTYIEKLTHFLSIKE